VTISFSRRTLLHGMIITIMIADVSYCLGLTVALFTTNLDLVFASSSYLIVTANFDPSRYTSSVSFTITFFLILEIVVLCMKFNLMTGLVNQ
jgi:hypothetical protein